ncbi:hypothetical protein AGMMS49579_15760 [Spirochaetia bacterium]|nr:hypothetical protein AGMMS49579_15760 [Spirochaetia bacterium]
MRVFFDTNVIVDIIEQRELFFKHSSAVFLMAVNGQIEGLIGAGSITDLYYITRNAKDFGTSPIPAISPDDFFNMMATLR